MNPDDRCESGREPLTEIERLLTKSQRRTVTVEEHLHFQRSIVTDSQGRDEIDQAGGDDAAADPILDRIPQHRAKHKVRGVLGILDQLDKANTNRRFTH